MGLALRKPKFAEPSIISNFDFKKPDYLPIIQYRSACLDLISSDDYQLETFANAYYHDPIAFIQDWGITYNPEHPTNKVLPFILFPRQKEFLLWLYDLYLTRKDGLAEKCRNVGMTWCSVAFAVWVWIFRRDNSIGFGSRKESYVDELGNPKSIFEKIRIYIKHLPPQFVPAYSASYMKIINNDNGSIIEGEAGDNIGRGGRSSIYFVDEADYLQHPKKAEAALFSNSACKVYISSPNGLGWFFEKRSSGDMPVFTFVWYDDPRKTRAWYDETKSKTDPVIFAQEVDISYTASIDGVIIPADYVLAAINLELPKEGKRIAMLDVADEGKDLNVYTLRHGVVVEYIESWRGVNSDVVQTAFKAHELNKRFGVEEFRYDNIGVGAGILGAFNLLRDNGVVNYVVSPFTASEKPTNDFYSEDKRNRDMFLNLKAQSWWELRDRFFKTYKYVGAENKDEFEIDDLISIPDNKELLSELSSVTYKYNSSGKIQVRSNQELKIKSPDFASSLVGLFSQSKFWDENDVISLGFK
jgi:hypothetical protein